MDAVTPINDDNKPEINTTNVDNEEIKEVAKVVQMWLKIATEKPALVTLKDKVEMHVQKASEFVVTNKWWFISEMLGIMIGIALYIKFVSKKK